MPDARQDSSVIVLVGPKGAGKSTVGRLLEESEGVLFVDVEGIFRNLADPSNVIAGYEQVGREVSKRLESARAVSIELTGAARETPELLRHLRRRHAVRMVRLTAPLAVCLRRIRQRDASRHLPSSEELVRKVHAISEALPWEFDITVDTSLLPAAEVAEIVADELR